MDTMSRNTHPQVPPSTRQVPNDKRIDNTLRHWPYYIGTGR